MSAGQPTIGVRELRGDLAAALRRAAAGHTVTVSVAGRPTATLGPVESLDGAATIDALVAAGLLLPPRRNDPPRVVDPVPVWTGVRLDRVFREVRG